MPSVYCFLVDYYSVVCGVIDMQHKMFSTCAMTNSQLNLPDRTKSNKTVNCN